MEKIRNLSKLIVFGLFLTAKTTQFNEDAQTAAATEVPIINQELSPNVTGVLGKEVRLSCHVEHLGNKTVSILKTVFKTIKQ